MENNKEMKFVLEQNDFKKNSKVSKETINNIFESFKNYLKALDTQNLTNLDEKGNMWTIDKLEKLETKDINRCRDLIKGEIALVNDNGKMSLVNSTDIIIYKLIELVNIIILIRKKIKELEK